MMEGVVQRGTAASLKQYIGSTPFAGKTGTTNESKDTWFVGYTPDLVVGVFLGYDTPRPMGHSATGGAVALPVVGSFLKLALADKKPVPFRQPPGIKQAYVSHKTGVRATPGTPDAILEAFKPNEEPDDEYHCIGFCGTDSASAFDPRSAPAGTPADPYASAGPRPVGGPPRGGLW
jgi:penicillin-binding protein 1A